MKKTLYFFALLLCVSCGKKQATEEHACCATDEPVVVSYAITLQSEALLDSIANEFSTAKKEGTLTPALDSILDAKYEAQSKVIKADYAKWFEKNINTEIGQKVLSTSKWVRRLSGEQLGGVLAKADTTFKATELYQKLAERADNMKTSTAGNPYKEIISKTPAGVEGKLSAVAGKGKYVLLDFWASWCPPCRAEMPHLVKLYNTYKDKNFEIVGYSLDRDEVAWKKGIADLKMTWPQLSDVQYWDSAPVKAYAVQGIPCTFLIDPQGNIIERELVGEALDAALEKYLK